MEKIRTNEMPQIAASILIAQITGAIGSFFTTPAIPTWYAALRKPPFSPPNWLFAPVWISLYTLMGLSAFLIWRQRKRDKPVREALAIYTLQLILNASWSAAFFGLRSPTAGVLVIIVLWLAILLNIQRFFKISRIAGLMLIPYLLWVSFAAVLNYSIMILNP